MKGEDLISRAKLFQSLGAEMEEALMPKIFMVLIIRSKEEDLTNTKMCRSLDPRTDFGKLQKILLTKQLVQYWNCNLNECNFQISDCK